MTGRLSRLDGRACPFAMRKHKFINGNVQAQLLPNAGRAPCELVRSLPELKWIAQNFAKSRPGRPFCPSERMPVINGRERNTRFVSLSGKLPQAENAARRRIRAAIGRKGDDETKALGLTRQHRIL